MQVKASFSITIEYTSHDVYITLPENDYGRDGLKILKKGLTAL